MSAVDLVLFVVILVLLMLLVLHRRNQPAAEPRSRIDYPKKLSGGHQEIEDTSTESLLKKPLAESFQKCVHHLGYLKNLSKDMSIPDECLGCPEVYRCISLSD